jgi:uncharacterized protein YhjY with autotransporter beta-barrel domain
MFHKPTPVGSYVFLTLITLGLLCPLLPSHGQVITLTPTGNDLYNTGYNGITLAGPNEIDTHYTITNFGTGQTFQANPLAAGWVPNSANSQWITISNSTNLGPSITFEYRLVLTHIPVGSLVTISGLVAADDNATISANGKSPVFSNYSPTVVSNNYGVLQPFTGLTFVAGTTNYIIIAVNNGGGFATGLDLQLTGFYTPLTSTTGLGLAITPPNLTQNQTAVVGSINRIIAAGTTNTCFLNLTTSLLGASTTTIGPDLDQLSPERLGVLSTIAFNNASFFTQDLDDYLAHRRNADGNLQVYPDHIDATGLKVADRSIDPQLAAVHSRLLAWNPAPARPGVLSDSADALGMTAPPPRNFAQSWNIFLRGDVILGQDYSQPEIQHSNYTTSSFEVGSDCQIGDHWLTGVLFDYNHTDTGLDSMGSSATVDSYAPGLFASYADGGWFANALGSYSWNAYTTERHIGFGSFNETADGAPTGNEVLGNVDGGYEFHSQRWTYGPIAGLQYVHYNMDPFSESGGCSADLNVNNQTDDSLRSRLGGRISYEMPDFDDKVIFTPYLEASWQHEYLAGSRCIKSSFEDFNQGTFIVSTPNASRDSALIAAGVNADITRSATLFSDYAVQVGADNYFGQSVEAGLKIAF